MLYSRLVQDLSRLESKYLGNGTRYAHTVPRQAARFIVDRENVQYFALDSSRACPPGKSMRDIDAEVVVTVGANYSQGFGNLPSSSPSGLVRVWPFVEDDLQQMRFNLDLHFHWYDTGHLGKDWITEDGRTIYRYPRQGQKVPVLSGNIAPKSSSDAPVPTDERPLAGDELTGSPVAKPRAAPHRHYHLVTANFTPWITSEAWSTIRNGHASHAASIFDYPPHGARTFVEFDDLRKILPDDTIWVGHGYHDVAGLFNELSKHWSLRKWFFFSNLAQPPVPRHPPSPGISPLPRSAPGTGNVRRISSPLRTHLFSAAQRKKDCEITPART